MPKLKTPEPGVKPLQRLCYTVNEFCLVTGCSRAIFYTEISAGRLRAHKCGHRTLITIEDLKAWLDGLPLVGTDGSEFGTVLDADPLAA